MIPEVSSHRAYSILLFIDNMLFKGIFSLCMKLFAIAAALLVLTLQLDSALHPRKWKQERKCIWRLLRRYRLLKLQGWLS